MNKQDAAIVERGRKVWQEIGEQARLRWGNWITIGKALAVGRTETMRALHTNQPLGRAYNKAFSAWLRENAFDKIDGSIRSRLAECMDNLEEIEAWRDTLSDKERIEFNHPNTVIRRWKAYKATPKALRSSPVARLQAKVEKLEAKNARLLASGGDRFSAKDSAKAIAAVLFDMLNDTKFEGVINRMLELQVEHGRMTKEAIAQIKADVKAQVLGR